MILKIVELSVVCRLYLVTGLALSIRCTVCFYCSLLEALRINFKGKAVEILAKEIPRR